MKLLTVILTLPVWLARTSPTLFDEITGPNVTLDSATVSGINQGALSKFLGIPFAVPP